MANSTVAPIVATVNSTTEVDSTSHNGTALWFYETGSEGACKEVNRCVLLSRSLACLEPKQYTGASEG